MTDRPEFRRSTTGASGDPSGAPTGPFTHGQIAHLMKTEFARARRHDYPVSCLLLQVDRLRALSELYGSEVRAEAKRVLGRIVGENTRGHDHLGSMADGVYLLVLAHTDHDEARAVAERVRTAFGALELEIAGTTLELTLSVGISACNDRETMFFETLVSQAEVALDWAVRAGGDQVVLFERERFVKAAKTT